MPEMNLLSTELQVFEQHRKEWFSSHPGEYVAIQDDVVADFFVTFADAFRAGLNRFGVGRNFLV